MLRLIETLVVVVLCTLFTLAYAALTGGREYSPNGNGRHARNGRRSLARV